MWKIIHIGCLRRTEYKRNSEWSKKSKSWNGPLKPNPAGLSELLTHIYFSVSFNRNKDRKVWAYWGRKAYSREHQNSLKNLTDPFITKIRMMSCGSVGWSLRSGGLSNEQKQYFELKVRNLHVTSSSDSLPVSSCAKQLHHSGSLAGLFLLPLQTAAEVLSVCPALGHVYDITQGICTKLWFKKLISNWLLPAF